MIQLDVNIPDGYRATGKYDYPVAGEFYLDSSNHVSKRESGKGFLPRIIVEPIPAKKREAWVNLSRYGDRSMVSYSDQKLEGARNNKGSGHLLTIHVITEEVGGKVVASEVTVV